MSAHILWICMYNAHILAYGQYCDHIWMYSHSACQCPWSQRPPKSTIQVSTDIKQFWANQCKPSKLKTWYRHALVWRYYSLLEDPNTKRGSRTWHSTLFSSAVFLANCHVHVKNFAFRSIYLKIWVVAIIMPFHIQQSKPSQLPNEHSTSWISESFCFNWQIALSQVFPSLRSIPQVAENWPAPKRSQLVPRTFLLAHSW